MEMLRQSTKVEYENLVRELQNNIAELAELRRLIKTEEEERDRERRELCQKLEQLTNKVQNYNQRNIGREVKNTYTPEKLKQLSGVEIKGKEIQRWLK